jgi:osmotically-inducible protein OsmY
MKSPVKHEQIVADFVITSHILGAFKANPQIPFNDVEVLTRNGCVTLTGSLQCEFQNGIVNNLVENMVGVVEINNYIAINSDATSTYFWSYSAN